MTLPGQLYLKATKDNASLSYVHLTAQFGWCIANSLKLRSAQNTPYGMRWIGATRVCTTHGPTARAAG